MPVLVVNVDHAATLRQARMGAEPDPVLAAHEAELGGAQGIIVHLREDRRHIQDRDLALLRQTVRTRLHLEMAATEEMQRIALETLPYMVCLVPEKRQELTTEGGLDCVGREQEIADYLAPLHARGMLSSLFIDPEPAQIQAAAEIGAPYVELHTGAYADAPEGPGREKELARLFTAVDTAQRHGLRVNLGHGLNYSNILPFGRCPGIHEFSIGHSIMARSLFTGIRRAVRDMVDLIAAFPRDHGGPAR